MKYIKTFEGLNSPIVYDESYDYGSVFGVIHNNWNNVANWFHKYGDYEEGDRIINELKSISDLPIAFLNNINVEERGKGYGNKLYDEFEDFVLDNDTNCIVLISDNDESQESGFVLDDWYIKKGFEKIGTINGNPVMIKFNFL